MEYRIHVADHCHTDDNQDKRKYFFIQKYMKKCYHRRIARQKVGIIVYGNKVSVVISFALLNYLNYKNTWLTYPLLSVGMLSLKR